ncbi:hypothetical protein WJX84_011253 [Apatococcus fuscideae]|uniref:Protoporphyrinogen oxidase n=1 Tax=Apatococcus fuscideae TaxID=2026836 RepID=A0AAW1RE30_9CHLO
MQVEAGIEKKLVFGDPKAPRFVWWQNKLRPTPSGPDALTFDLLSIGGKLRAAFGAVGLKPKAPGNEETVEQFVRRNLGDEVFERLIEPFCSGVYAGSPNKLSMKAAFGKIQGLEQAGGSLVGGAISMMRNKPKGPKPERDPRLPEKPKGQTVGSFTGGLQALPDGMAKRLSKYIRKQWVLRELRRDSEGVLELHYDTPKGARRLRTRSMSLTIPAHAAADLLRSASPETCEALRSIDYPPVAAVAVSYPLSAIREDRKDAAGKLPGFGQLHPRSQGITTLGTIYSSSLFPGRCPEGQQLLLNYFGGTTNRKVQDMSPEDVVAQVDKDLKQMLLKADAPAPHVVGYRLWPKAIPQFNVGHLELVQGAQDDLKSAGFPEVFLGGNYMAGVALGKCVEYGYTEAARLSDFLSQSAIGNTNSPEKAQDEAFYGSVV